MTKREFIRRASKQKTIDIDVKAGGRVRIRGLSFSEVEQMLAMRGGEIAAMRFAVSRALQDDKGSPMLKGEKDPAFRSMQFATVKAIADRIYKLSRVERAKATAGGIEDVTK